MGQHETVIKLGFYKLYLKLYIFKPYLPISKCISWYSRENASNRRFIKTLFNSIEMTNDDVLFRIEH